MSAPFYLKKGLVFRHNKTVIEFVEMRNEVELVFRRTGKSNNLYKVKDQTTGRYGFMTVEFAIREFAAGRLVDPDYVHNASQALEANLHLDRAACVEIDKKTGWRFDWAWEARNAGLKRSIVAASAWIAATAIEPTDGIPNTVKPGARSLLRWWKTLDDYGWRIGALVSCGGRPIGHSQLNDVEDRLVHKWSMIYWNPDDATGRLEHKEDAAALVVIEWHELKKMGVPGLGEEPPSSECVRSRINSLECYETYAARNGKITAEKRFHGNGEAVAVQHPFERIYIDGVEWEHLLHYSEEFPVTVPKLRSVISMDALTSFIFPFPTFADDYRSAYGMAALRNVMVPPELSEEEIKNNPEESLIFAAVSDVMYDRDRTMISARMVPGVLSLTSTIELARAYHSDAKAKLERFHSYAKQFIGSKVKGRILGARQKVHMLDYNPMTNVDVFRSQYIDLLKQVRHHWNWTPKKSLGGLSPGQVMLSYIKSSCPRLIDSSQVRRNFASIPPKRQVLTTDGLIYDNVHYRWNREGVTEALSANSHRVAIRKRLEGTAKIEVSIRVWDDDVDYVEFYDEANKTYHGLWSTEPEYTGGLSRHEHQFYVKSLRKGMFNTPTRFDKAMARVRSLEAIQATLGKKPLRDRRQEVGVLDGEMARRSGKRAQNPNCASVPELYTPTEVGGLDRVDIPTPPPQGREDLNPALPEGSQDVRSDPQADLERENGADLGGHGSHADDWDFSDFDEDEED